ncbi:MAG: nuclear transport factor 2 family protein [Hyphomicrobiales bacterium]|nr:nuclear transport factor 2 family protein [Hyphomicrobiales bacterium]
MSEDSTRAIVTTLYDAYERGDAERVASLIDDEIDWILHAPSNVFHFAGQRRGKAEALHVLAAIAAEYALISYRPQIIIVEGERAAVLSDVAFKQCSTQRVMRFQIVNFLRVRNGKVVEFREFLNTFDAVEQSLGRLLAVGDDCDTYLGRTS